MGGLSPSEVCAQSRFSHPLRGCPAYPAGRLLPPPPPSYINTPKSLYFLPIGDVFRIGIRLLFVEPEGQAGEGSQQAMPNQLHSFAWIAAVLSRSVVSAGGRASETHQGSSPNLCA